MNANALRKKEMSLRDSMTPVMIAKALRKTAKTLEGPKGVGDSLEEVANILVGLEGTSDDCDALGEDGGDLDHVQADLAGASDEDDELEGTSDTEKLLLLLPQPRRDPNTLFKEDSLRHRQIGHNPTHFKESGIK